MRRLLIYIAIVFISSSCLKKMQEVDELDTNIFDKEYAGDKWFYIDDAYLYFNDAGLPRIHIIAILPGSNMPELKPYSLQVQCSVNDQPSEVVTAIIDNDGNYPFYYDAIPETPGIYCLSAGIYVDADDTAINTFEECTEL